MLRPADLASIPDRVKPTPSGVSRLDTLSGQVQPIRYRMNPPPAYVPEREIGTTTTFTLQVTEFHTSYTIVFSSTKPPLATGKERDEPPKRYARGVFLTTDGGFGSAATL